MTPERKAEYDAMVMRDVTKQAAEAARLRAFCKDHKRYERAAAAQNRAGRAAWRDSILRSVMVMRRAIGATEVAKSADAADIVRMVNRAAWGAWSKERDALALGIVKYDSGPAWEVAEETVVKHEGKPVQVTRFTNSAYEGSLLIDSSEEWALVDKSGDVMAHGSGAETLNKYFNG